MFSQTDDLSDHRPNAFGLAADDIAITDSVRVFGVEIAGVTPTPTRTSVSDGFVFVISDGVDVGPFENLGGDLRIFGPDGQEIVIQTGMPDLMAPGGRGAKAAKALLSTKAGRTLLRKGGVLNRNPYVRIGVGRRGGESVLRIAFGRTGRVKIDIVTLGDL